MFKRVCRATAMIVSSALLAAATLPVGSASAAITAVNHNIAGNTKHGGSESAWALTNSLLTGDTWVVTAQEVCHDQYEWEMNALRFFLGTVWHGTFRTQYSGNGFCGKEIGEATHYGSATFGKSTGVSSDIREFPASEILHGSFTNQYPGDAENRGWNCARLVGFGVYLACTAHMTSSNQKPYTSTLSYRELQTKQFITVAALGVMGGQYVRVWWGGDFYVNPGEMLALDPGLTGWSKEADQCVGPGFLSKQPTRDGSLTAIDYLFLTTPASCSGDLALAPGDSGSTPWHSRMPGEFNWDHRALGAQMSP